jgi:hypothetical protein
MEALCRQLRLRRSTSSTRGAATFRARTTSSAAQTIALALFQASAYDTRPPSDVDQELRELRERWGTLDHASKLLAQICPTLYESPKEREWFANQLRVGASPAAAHAVNRMWSETDLRDILSAIHVPTLVMARGEIGEKDSREVTERVRNSRYVRIPGNDYWGMFLSPEIVDELERFVDTLEHAPEPETVLATVLFTDLVSSSERAAKLGDREWAELLSRHNAAIRQELARFRGGEVDTAGDGSSPASTDRPGRSAVLARSSRRFMSSASRFVSVFIPASAKSSLGSRPESLSTRALELPRPQGRARCS